MSTARHHAEWLSLVEVSGPFLSMPVLLRVFPQGLDAHDPDHARNLRLAHEEWEDNQGGLRADPAIHRAWVRFVLTQTLGFPEEVLAEGQALPAGLEARLAEHGETLRPDLAIVAPEGFPNAGKARLLLDVYPRGQGLERVVEGRLWKASPATRMMELLHATGVPLGLVTNGEHWMLVYAPRGETTGFASWYAELWLEEHDTLRAFRSLLGVQRFFGVADEDTLEALFRASSQDQQEVTDQLGYQVRKAVEVLVQAIDRIDKDRDRQLLRGADEKRLYEAALTVMMRLVFLFSAEERGLLLLGDPVYDQHYAVSTLRTQLREGADLYGEEVLERRHDAWSRLLATFRAVYGGVTHERLSLPPYGGTLFDPDRFPFLEGREAKTGWETTPAQPLPIHNRTVLHLLEALQILQVKVPGGGPAEARRLSFRALDIEQIGHVYEGLLDHTAVRASGAALGLAGTRDREPEIALAKLEAMRGKGEAALVSFLKEETGRSESALKNALAGNPTGAGRRGRNASANGAGLLTPDTGTNTHPRLLAACDNNDALYERMLPFAGLLREDTQGYPVVITDGSVYVTQGSDRRTTGTHYTPRSLTESIVQNTMDPLVYAGPAEGQPKEEWRLRSAREILELKVCDPAMGSGAFLVQACRYLSERLVEAWETAEAASPGKVVVTPEGDLSTGAPEERPLPPDPEERLALARRIVADHCLYGVDRNPVAVEMAKLSLWLITLAKGKPFTFLDHRLRHGDSLVGAMWHEPKPGKLRPLPPEIPDAAFSSRELRERNQREREGQLSMDAAALPGGDLAARYRKLAEFPDDPEGQREKAAYFQRLRQDDVARRRRLAADLWCAAWFWPASGPAAPYCPTTAAYRAALERGREPAPETLAQVERLRERIPFFHWALEFPDVYEAGGFSAVVGNPPFMGGLKMETAFSTEWRSHVVAQIGRGIKGVRGTADLCTYFFLRAIELLRRHGHFGMLATNTIAQGDSRTVGLEQICSSGATITRAVPSKTWPGAASLEIAIVHVFKGPWNGVVLLGDRTVSVISPLLDSTEQISDNPKPLKANAGKCFTGSFLMGLGFILSPDQAKDIIRRHAPYRDVLFPYLNGADVNSQVDQSATRWVINFYDWPLDHEHAPAPYAGRVAADYPELLNILEERVKPEREGMIGRNPMATRRGRLWWHYAGDAKNLYAAIKVQTQVIVLSLVNNHLGFVFVENKSVFSNKLAVFAMDTWEDFAVLQSSFHYHWAWQYSSTMKTDINYSPSVCFDPFPFPTMAGDLYSIGETYHDFRKALMSSRGEGLTKTYNRFHNLQESAEDIVRLRELHVEMDHAVAAAYGWTDLELGHGFHGTKQGTRYTLCEAARREVLGRLLKLNHERYAEEVAQGLHDKGKPKSNGKRGGKRGQNDVEAGLLSSGQRDLFDAQLSLGDAL